MNDILLIANNICKGYYTSNYERVEVLHNLEFSISRGEIISIMGPSGSGKTTLLNLLGGLDRIDSGEVLFMGKDINRLKDDELSHYRNKHIGFIFQFHHLLEDLNILENVIIPHYILHRDWKAASNKAMSLLEELGIGDRANFKPNQISGGQRQRVAIARALINNPDVLIADEPTGNLDEDNANTVINMFFALARKYGMSVIIATHNPDIANMTDMTYKLLHGRLYK